MKNRKSILVVFAVLALLCLGIGYAALTDTLGINGTAEGNSSEGADYVDETLFDIEWDSTVNPTAVVSGPEGSLLSATAAYDGTDAAENNARITINDMIVKNETVVATFTIKNASSEDYIAELSANIVITYQNGSEQCLSATYRFIDDGDNLSASHDNDNHQSVVIKKGGTAKIEVTITMNETLLTGTRSEPQILDAIIEVEISGSHIDKTVANMIYELPW